MTDDERERLLFQLEWGLYIDLIQSRLTAHANLERLRRRFHHVNRIMITWCALNGCVAFLTPITGNELWIWLANLNCLIMVVALVPPWLRLYLQKQAASQTVIDLYQVDYVNLNPHFVPR